MTSRAMVDEFFAQEQLALIRASRKAKVLGCRIDKELCAKGYSVSVVYLDEDDPASRLMDLKPPITGLMIAVPSAQTEEAVQHAIKAKIQRVWIQEGSESPAAIKLCEEHDIALIHGECILMFAEPVKSFHAFHRWIWKLFGKLPS
jgi:predicted CoA-binding protein